MSQKLKKKTKSLLDVYT